MAITNLSPAPTQKTRYVLNLTSGTSWTVPAGVAYVNATLVGGGGGTGGTGGTNTNANPGNTGGTTTFTGATSAVGGVGLQVNTYVGLDVGGGGNSLGPAIAGVANSGLGGIGYIYNRFYSSSGAFIVPAQPVAQAGQIFTTSVTTTPGASITYSIGAGGTGGTAPAGGTAGVSGGSGRIELEYWV